MQGMYSFGGSFVQFVAPIMASYIFEQSGYQLVYVIQIGALSLAVLLMISFYEQLVPLQLKRTEDTSA